MPKIEKAKEVVVIGAILHHYLTNDAQKYWIEMYEENIVRTHGKAVLPVVFSEYEEMVGVLE